MNAGDIVLIIDDAGQIVDGSANLSAFPDLPDWIGQNWRDTVTSECIGKVDELLQEQSNGLEPSARHLNQKGDSGEIPVSYRMMRLGDGKRRLALGRDMRDAAVLQQRLLQAQQSLERDYLRLRQLETRYRLLFEMSGEPVLIIDSENRRIVEANPVAHTLLMAKPGTLVGSKFLALFDRNEREALIAFLGAALTSSSVSPVEARLADQNASLTLTATGFRQRGKLFVLIRIDTGERSDSTEASAMLSTLESMPDAFVLTDADWRIVAANLAFAELIGAASIDQVRGRLLGEFVGRPGIDLELIQGQLQKQGYARNVNSVIGASDSLEGEPIELSAVRTGEDEPHIGVVIRPIARRLRDLPPMPQEMPRSVEQLTELVGRMSLKDIVRESTDLIERLCIEAALAYTSDNRASAAEILGLSRQSLYSKLHRYGLGNLATEPE
ncbi:transcriptional regulator PpsR [Altererythrobacter sp. BO-6]|uniref:transcriptional regulator PpsR n=1 Tax=Altererythrobacter sp. BO-6 TaxID=2604537 RepID=UPI0013E0F82D|nr:transcriptional regulator PpsR [Altererythrobacter sp. BO-6]QIG54691.1 transcriptional regulator PpsR [Altererythrobacter sp. BO-6]